MTESEFKTLRDDIAGLRKALADHLGDTTRQFAETTRQFAEIEAKLDTKPDKGFIYQAVATINGAMLGAVVAAIIILNVTGAFN